MRKRLPFQKVSASFTFRRLQFGACAATSKLSFGCSVRIRILSGGAGSVNSVSVRTSILRKRVSSKRPVCFQLPPRPRMLPFFSMRPAFSSSAFVPTTSYARASFWSRSTISASFAATVVFSSYVAF